jgi:hypothetical protein
MQSPSCDLHNPHIHTGDTQRKAENALPKQSIGQTPCVFNKLPLKLHRPCAPPGKARTKVLDGSPYPDHKDEESVVIASSRACKLKEQVRPSHFQHAPGCRTTVPPPCMMGNHLVRLRHWCVLHHIEGEQQHIRASMCMSKGGGSTQGGAHTLSTVGPGT